MTRYRFADAVLDTARRELTHAGDPVALSPRAFEALQILLKTYPGAVSRDDLYSALWPDTFVNLTNLNNVIAEIRAAIHDDDKAVVVTKHRFGYVIGVPVTDDSIAASRFTLSIAGERIALREGENVVGRASDAAVLLDLPSISRRHAVIRIRGDRAEIADLESKNGTFVGDERVGDRGVVLHAPATVRFGSVAGVFSARSNDGTTITEP